MMDRLLCSANRLERQVRGTGDGCSLENVSSTRSPEAGSRASETRPENMGASITLSEEEQRCGRGGCPHSGIHKDFMSHPELNNP
jgi:hypothetical protein